MKKSILLLTLFIISISAFSQRKTQVLTVDIVTEQGQGFSGTVDFVYTFNNCFGDVQMLYTYKNVNITGFYYERQFLSASDLGLSNFNKYLLSPTFKIGQIRKVSSFSTNGTPFPNTVNYGDKIKENVVLKNTLDLQLAGCYGQTHKLGKYKKLSISRFNTTDTKHLDPKYILLRNVTAYFNWNSLLSDLAKCKLDPYCDIDEEKKITKKEIIKEKAFENRQIMTAFFSYNSSFTNHPNARPFSSNSKYYIHFDTKCNLNHTLKQKIKAESLDIIERVKMNSEITYSKTKWTVSINYKLDKIDVGLLTYGKFSEILKNSNKSEWIEIKKEVYSDGAGNIYVTNFNPNCK